MNIRHILLASLAALTPSLAQAGEVFLPGGSNQPSEGAGNSVLFTPTEGTRIQFFYDTSLFGNAPITISGFAMRYDMIVTPNGGNEGNINFGDLFQVKLATLAGTIGATFADNIATNAQTVMSGAQSVHYVVGNPAGFTKPFGIQFNFATPYVYDPAAGKLVVDIRAPAVDQFVTIDTTFDNGFARVVAFDPNATAGCCGGRNPGAAVLRLTTQDAVSAVPEPATWAMLVVGFGAVGGTLRRRRQPSSAISLT